MGAEPSIVLDPRGTVQTSGGRITERLDALEGATIGLLDNSKANADVLLDEVGHSSGRRSTASPKSLSDARTRVRFRLTRSPLNFTISATPS